MKTICDNYMIARTQRKNEIIRGLSEKHTGGYEKMGCYICEGTNKECPAYSTELNLRLSDDGLSVLAGGKDEK